LKKIPHFGTTEYLFYKFVSKIDVSTLFIPYKEVTYFHIDQFGFPPKKEFRAIITLLNELEKFPKSAEDKSAEKKERFMKLEKRRKTEQIICNFLMKNKGKAFTKYSLNKRCLELQQLGLEIDEIEDISNHLNSLGKIGLNVKEYEIFYYIR
jgi:ribosomal protein L9